jgi:phage FluMu protein Com
MERPRRDEEDSTNNRPSDDDLTTIDDTCAGTFARMSNEADEVRCAGCGRLLAKLRDGRLSVQRGELQATFDGEFHASFVCYLPRCRRLTVVRVRSQQPEEHALRK